MSNDFWGALSIISGLMLFIGLGIRGSIKSVTDSLNTTSTALSTDIHKLTEKIGETREELSAVKKELEIIHKQGCDFGGRSRGSC